MKWVMFVIIFLLIGAFFIASNGNLHFAKKAEFNQFAGAYYSWIGQIFSNAGKVTGYVVKMDWLP
jgi:hypothetical protein